MLKVEFPDWQVVRFILHLFLIFRQFAKNLCDIIQRTKRTNEYCKLTTKKETNKTIMLWQYFNLWAYLCLGVAFRIVWYVTTLSGCSLQFLFPNWFTSNQQVSETVALYTPRTIYHQSNSKCILDKSFFRAVLSRYRGYTLKYCAYERLSKAICYFRGLRSLCFH